jgi:hypothetical protein
MGHHDIIGLQVQMQYLMAVHVLEGAEHLLLKTETVFLAGEIIWIVLQELGQGISLNVLHEDAVVLIGHIFHQIRVAELATNLIFFLEGLHIARVPLELLLKTLEEAFSAIIINEKGAAGSSIGIQWNEASREVGG